jgi:glycosyltransferase involved in cell wall biosynthesis
MENISICMPIFNRNNFKRMILSNLTKLDYDKNKLEFCLLDDGTEPFFKDEKELKVFSDFIKPITMKYKYSKFRRSIGYKRNALVKMATHNIIACMDSDDLYMSTYLKYSLDKMKKEKVGLVGSPQMLFLYPHLDWRLTVIDCNVKRMIHEATMVFNKKYWKSMGGFNTEGTGEGCKMIDGMSDKKIGKTDIQHIMICICHNSNTVPKDQFKDSPSIKYNLSDFDIDLIKSTLEISSGQ